MPKLLASVLRGLAVLGLVLVRPPAQGNAQNPEYCQPAPNPECTMCSSSDCDYVGCGGPGGDWCMWCDIVLDEGDEPVRVVVGNACD